MTDIAGEEELLFEEREGIGLVTFNRPQARNALTFAMYEKLAEICSAAGERRVGAAPGTVDSPRHGFATAPVWTNDQHRSIRFGGDSHCTA